MVSSNATFAQSAAVNESVPWPTALDQRRVAADFYDTYWHTIISARTPQITEYLRCERELASATIDRCGYRGLVEVGCADGTLLLSVAVGRGLDYLGVDLAADAIDRARSALAKTAVGSAVGSPHTAVVQRDVRDLAALPGTLLPRSPRLVAFPFNVLAGITTPVAALRAAAAIESDLLVFSYQTSWAASTVRRDYYRACGLTGRFNSDDRGVHFTAGLFTSSVYHEALVIGWLERLGYQVELIPFAAVGLAYHARRRAPL